MCNDRSCYEGSCERCRKIDRLCDWPYKKPIIKTVEVEEIERNFWLDKGKESVSNEFKRKNRENI